MVSLGRFRAAKDTPAPGRRPAERRRNVRSPPRSNVYRRPEIGGSAVDYLLWFKNDLRLDDNPALLACLDGHSLLPVYLFDPDDLEPGPTGCRRLGARKSV